MYTPRSGILHIKVFLTALSLVDGRFDPELPLNQVPFLMSHDAATGYLGEDRMYDNPATAQELVIAWSKTQIGNISVQLGCGARAFDMRPYLTEDKTLIAHHGDVIIDYPFRDMMEEMIIWASQNPNELVVAEIVHCMGPSENLTEQCDLEVKKALIDMKIPFIYQDECPDTLKNMTFGDAMNRSALDNGGSLLAIWGDCFVSNYDSSRNCRGYEYESDGVSRKYACWIKPYGENPEYAVNHLLEYLNDTYTVGPPSSGMLWQMQALWQATGTSVSLGSSRNSSLLLDVLNSRLNRMLFENLLKGAWDMTRGGPNMFEADFVCDQGNNIRLALDPTFNGTVENYPDDVEVCPDKSRCPIDSDLIDRLPEYYRGPSFKSGASIRRYHRNARWGNTNDIVKFVIGTDKERNEYINGLFGTPILLWCTFGLWSIVLIFCKWTNKLGCLVGVCYRPGDTESSRMRNVILCKSNENEGSLGMRKVDREDHTFNEDALAENDDILSTEKGQDRTQTGIDGIAATEQNLDLRVDETIGNREVSEASPSLADMVTAFDIAKKKVRCVRITAITCGVLVVLFSGLLIGLGFDALDDTIESAEIAIPELRKVVETAYNASDDFLVYANLTKKARIEFLNSLFTLCEPRLYPPTSETNVFAFDLHIGSDDIIFINETLNNFTEIFEHVNSINRTLHKVDRNLMNLETTLNKIDNAVALYATLAFVVPYALMAIMFTSGVIIAWRKNQPRLFRDCPTRIALPIFLLFLVASYVSATFLLIGGTFTSDFCIETPDNQVLRMVGANPPFDENIEWYAKGCAPELKPELLYDYLVRTKYTLRSSSDFLFMLSESNPANIPCTNATELLDFALVFQQHLDAYSLLFEDLVLSLRCEKFNRLYTLIAYTAVCDKGFNALAKSFVFLFSMAIASMVLVTLRVAWLDLEDVVDQLEKPNGVCMTRTRGTLRNAI